MQQDNLFITAFFLLKTLNSIYMCDNMEAKESEVKDYTDMDRYAFVSQRAFDNGYVGYCYREWSDIKIDSGWRFLFGDEDEDYLENPDNSLTMDLRDVVAWKSELKSILSARQNTEYEWDDAEKKFIKL